MLPLRVKCMRVKRDMEYYHFNHYLQIVLLRDGRGRQIISSHRHASGGAGHLEIGLIGEVPNWSRLFRTLILQTKVAPVSMII